MVLDPMLSLIGLVSCAVCFACGLYLYRSGSARKKIRRRKHAKKESPPSPPKSNAKIPPNMFSEVGNDAEKFMKGENHEST